MLTVMWVLFLIILMFFFNGFLKKQYNPNQVTNVYTDSDNFKEVRLQRNRDGHYLSSGTINNTTVIFLLDTGATNVVIPFHIAKKIGLKTGQRTHSVTANGTVYTYATRLDRISIGTIEIHDVGASINPNTYEDVILLGMTFLKHLEFTQRGNTLTLKQYVE
ncbi:MAG TPA: TIGR02281 family clan AA aspartic protease [Methylococcaceae bacterium]|nr:TIGR02281 family clan AA aspartic protease [Methylococcaceae bacterium]HIN68114.1 TIGR02281 family clan AA aspartic protease [Methylococcales bacterium]HIA45414.1 TIGR02281 family clan AA aspartic protease [Methylococcaceae bacterium]HIB63042.1 TIGR02281 family clan AA aspartic protease [Methylococcaceae bacterium]HIO13341.1 TIGR02281 family clan AA aspartic protease [Methylococcales bacterium]